MKEKHKCLTWFSISIVLTIPFLCNFFLGLEHPQNISVVGKPTDWLLFFGSYVSGILSTIAAFYILYVNRKDSYRLVEIQLLHKEVLDMRDELAKRFTKINPLALIRISNYTEESFKGLSKEYDYLQEKLGECLALSYSARILYGNNNSPAGIYFYDSYDKLLEKTIIEIKNLSLCYSRYISKEYTCNLAEALNRELVSFSENLSKLAQENESVVEKANTYYLWYTEQLKKEQ